MRTARGSAKGRTRGQPHARGRVNTSFQVRDSKAGATPHMQMEHIASVSRSSGLEQGGDALKDSKVQEQYRVFVGEKLHKFWTEKQTKNGQENILILFRKLREGIFASKRSDAFAIEVYEISLCLSALFDSPIQTSSILSHLLPELYTSASIQPPISSVLISLLHHLIAGYPSQKTYFEHLSCLSPNEAYAWISNLATSLRTLNYIRVEALSRHDVYRHILSVSKSSDETNDELVRLSQDAVHALVERLRSKARDKAWVVLRSAYRELSASEETQTWMTKCLTAFNRADVREWMNERCRDGHLRPKEGTVGRWIVCKVR
ncbi:hypothetical protein DFJ58DRAFT_805199 [Suillus subalutaceus]|uniref:uncharacterized protein n=1 Tax=Suillus subalutaceus TaxID=48586 RepID=UPI001B85B5F0|nr:uncharacterized protein DFJ58DRAFT_805199 [Suillus subalutaceus]KAG1842989.1 hypothetical protein DFJ58DRAFT_805199 [Suillus subalutaceus]